jgi:hypothetical protein
VILFDDLIPLDDFLDKPAENKNSQKLMEIVSLNP